MLLLLLGKLLLLGRLLLDGLLGQELLLLLLGELLRQLRQRVRVARQVARPRLVLQAPEVQER